jgi:spore germination protein KB
LPEEIRIRALQLFWLLLVPRIAPVICFTPDLTGTPAPQCWRSNLPVIMTGLGLAFLYLALARRFPTETLIQYCPKVLGRWPGKLVGLMFIWFFLHVAVLDTRVFSEIYASAVLPETPLVVLMVLALAFIAPAVRSGLEVLARMAELLVPLLLLIVVGALLLAAKDMRLVRLLPLTEGGLSPVLLSALTPTALMGEAVVVTMLYPFLRDTRNGARAVLGAVLSVGVLGLLVSMAIVAVFGDERSHQLTFPFLLLVRYIEVAQILERLESLVIVAFIAVWFLKTGLFLYVTALGLAQWLGLPDHRALVLPLGTLLVTLSLLQNENLPEFLSFFKPDVYFPYASIFTVVLPALLLALSGRASPRGASSSDHGTSLGGDFSG